MTLKEWLRAIGIVILCIGLLCFPIGIGVSPKRDTSVFFNLADLGLFIQAGLALVTAGLALLLSSVLAPHRLR